MIPWILFGGLGLIIGLAFAAFAVYCLMAERDWELYKRDEYASSIRPWKRSSWERYK